jgi:hypothetical protein
VQCPSLISSTGRTGPDQLPDHGFRCCKQLRTTKSWLTEARNHVISRNPLRLSVVCAVQCLACITTAWASDAANLLFLRNDQGAS